jgi:DNA replication protein DnaC
MKSTETTLPAVEPKPAYAFSTFIKTRPALQEIAERTKIDTTDKTSPGHFCLKARFALEDEKPPRFTQDQQFQLMSTNPLMARLKNEDMTREQRSELQKQILEIQTSAFAPQTEHQKTIYALLAALNNAEQDFESWITLDPTGIAAAAQDNAYREWFDAEKARIAAEAKEAEEQARIEKARAERESEADYLACEIIGAALDGTDLNHPDIDGGTIQEFTGWHIESNSRWDNTLGVQRILNAILVGPPGVGKSRALAAAALHHCTQYGIDELEWITGYEFAELVSNLSTDKRDEANARLQEITQTTLLYFDDLGSANFTTARTSRFFRLIDERYRRKLPTFISTNYSTPQLKKIFTATGDSKDEAVRILRRIIGTPSEPLVKFFHFKRPQEAAKAA